MADILFKTDDYVFSYRVGGLLIHNGKVLMQKAVDELGNERIELDMCWIPLEDVQSKNIYPPQAKEYIVNIPDEIVYFVYKE